METFLALNRWIHIAAGFTGFFRGPGGPGGASRAQGRGGAPALGAGFFWAMVVAGSTALVGARHIHSLFLLLAAVFSLYMAGFGYRSLFLKQLAWDARVAPFDWAVAGVGLVVFGGTVAYAFWAGNVAVGVFGGIEAFTALRQLPGYVNAGHWTKNQWLLNHTSGFMAIGVPIIIWWQQRVRGQRVSLGASGPGLSA